MNILNWFGKLFYTEFDAIIKWSNLTTLTAVLVLNELLCLFGVVKCTRMFGLWLRILEFGMQGILTDCK